MVLVPQRGGDSVDLPGLILALGNLRPLPKAAAAQRARERRVIDFRYRLRDGLVAGYDMAGLSTYVDAAGLVKNQPHNLLSESEFRNGLSDVPTRGGLVSAASMVGMLGAVAIGWDGSTTAYAYKYPSLSISAGWVSAFVEMSDGQAPVFTGAVDFYFIFNGGTLAVGGYVIESVPEYPGRYRVSAPTPAMAAAGYVGMIKYGGNSSRAFKFSGLQVNAGAALLPYVATTTAPRHLPALYDNGVRALRLEGPQVQLFRGTNDVAGSQWGTSASLARSNAAAVGPGGAMSMCAIECVGSGFAFVDHGLLTGAPTTGALSARFAVRGGAGVSYFSFGLYDPGSGYSQEAGEARVVRGPGAITSGGGSNAQYGLAGLSPSELTIVEVVRVGGFSGAWAGFYFYPKGASPEVGDTFYFEPMLAVDGAILSSDIPNPAAASVLRPGAQQVISGAEFDRLFQATGTPSLTACTLLLKLGKRPVPFSAASFVLFALNDAAGSFGAGHGLRVRSNGTGISVGGASADSAFTGALVDGGNVIGIGIDVPGNALMLSVNGSATITLAGSGYTGVAAALARLRGQDSAGTNGDGAVHHQTIEVLPPMSAAALPVRTAAA